MHVAEIIPQWHYDIVLSIENPSFDIKQMITIIIVLHVLKQAYKVKLGSTVNSKLAELILNIMNIVYL